MMATPRSRKLKQCFVLLILFVLTSILWWAFTRTRSRPLGHGFDSFQDIAFRDISSKNSTLFQSSLTGRFREDERCGGDYLAPNGAVAECDAEGEHPCCSPSHWCGSTADHCDCAGCVDHRGRYYGSKRNTGRGIIGFLTGFYEDTMGYMRRHQRTTYIGGLTAGQPSIVCPEIDIPGHNKNLTIDVSEIDLMHVEEEIFKKDLFDVRKFTSDANHDVRAMYRRQREAASRGLLLKDVISQGMRVGDYWYVPGGHWIPAVCMPRWKVAVIIPFRDRFVHLPIILRHLVPFLRAQYLEFGIFFVEQANNLEFNRAMLMNVGYLEALNYTQWDCFIFHDVDHIPLSHGNYYGCGGMPRHFLSGADRWGYKLLYSFFFGAVTGFTRSQVEEFNGFPNVYWGWGGEDDDILGRMRSIGLAKTRPWGVVGFYNVIPHHHRSAKKNTNRVCLLDHYRQRLKTDGLNNLRYATPTATLLPLYTNISVDIQHLPWNVENWPDCRGDA